jgi:predicted AAA+ superfamily ATPase
VTRRNFPRLLAESAELALTDTPVAMLVGPRQAGKSTLAEWLAREALSDARHVTLDDVRTLAAARSDPTAFVEAAEGTLVIDEIQRAPDLMLAIKASVDRDRRPGRFVLTGSANVLTLPTVSESLAGRVEILTLWPLSQLEIEDHDEADFVTRLFDPGARAPSTAPIGRAELIERVLRGGFPPVVQRPDPKRRSAWLASYLTTLVQRDVRDIANIAGATDLPHLLRALALRTTQPLNKSGLAATLGMPYSTLDRYLALLMLLYVVHPIPAWHGNHGKRLVKAPKLLVVDSGLAAHLLAADADAFERGTADLGAATEAFVGMELVRLAGIDPVRATVHHYRTRTGAEIDCLLEAPDGRVVGIEVKAGATVGAGDFRHLAALRDALGERFVRGVVLHLGEQPLPFGDRLAAWPISALWSTR